MWIAGPACPPPDAFAQRGRQSASQPLRATSKRGRDRPAAFGGPGLHPLLRDSPTPPSRRRGPSRRRPWGPGCPPGLGGVWCILMAWAGLWEAGARWRRGAGAVPISLWSVSGLGPQAGAGYAAEGPSAWMLVTPPLLKVRLPAHPCSGLELAAQQLSMFLKEEPPARKIGAWLRLQTRLAGRCFYVGSGAGVFGGFVGAQARAAPLRSPRTVPGG